MAIQNKDKGKYVLYSWSKVYFPSLKVTKFKSLTVTFDTISNHNHDLTDFLFVYLNAKLISVLTLWKSQTNTVIYKCFQNVYNVLNKEKHCIDDNLNIKKYAVQNLSYTLILNFAFLKNWDIMLINVAF